jgi:Membrane-associated sensor, integral membrane domain
MANPPEQGEDVPATSSGPALRVVLLVVVVMAALAAALLPIASHPGPAIPGVVALFVAVFLVTELSTSFLLFVRFRELRTWSLLLLCCAYFYAGLVPIPHLLTFPGAVLTGAPLIATSPQSTSWIFVLWVNGFALLTLVSVTLEAWFGERRVAAHHVGRAAALGLGATLIAAVAAVGAVLWTADRLPPLVTGPSWTSAGWIASWLAIGLLGAGLIIVLLVIRERSRLYLWLGLALTAMICANVLATAGGGRFTVGWSIGRLSWLVSSCVLFVYLMILHARDQYLLVRASDLLRHGVQGGFHGSLDGRLDRDLIGAVGSGHDRKTLEVALASFVARENVVRYRRMLQAPQDEAHRQVLLRMLAQEETRLARFNGFAH